MQYAVSALVFLFFGFCLMMLLRWQLAYPGQPLPVIGKLLSESTMPGGVMAPEFYNQLGAMHGTIMVFMGVEAPRGYFWGAFCGLSGAALVGASAGAGAFSAAHLANSAGVSISTSARIR